MEMLTLDSESIGSGLKLALLSDSDTNCTYQAQKWAT